MVLHRCGYDCLLAIFLFVFLLNNQDELRQQRAHHYPINQRLRKWIEPRTGMKPDKPPRRTGQES